MKILNKKALSEIHGEVIDEEKVAMAEAIVLLELKMQELENKINGGTI